MIEDRLMVYLAGNNDTAKLREFSSTYPEDTSDAITRLTAVVAGNARDRLGQLAFSLSLVERWCEEASANCGARRRKAFSRLAAVAEYGPAYRAAERALRQGLGDPDEETRLSAARALAQSGNKKDVLELFELALAETAANRSILSSMLRPHATTLSFFVAANVAEIPCPSRALAMLEILESWECALVLGDIRAFARHSDASVRAKSMRLLARLAMTAENQCALIMGLCDSEAQVSISAAKSAAALKAVSAIPSLEMCLHRGNAELAQTARQALENIQLKDGYVRVGPSAP